MYLDRFSSFDEVIESSDHGKSWKSLKFIKEVLFLHLKQFPVGGVLQRLVPEAPHIDPTHLRKTVSLG